MNYLTTAIYPNRIDDRNKVEKELSINEFGNNTKQFFIKNNLFAIGYNRIVYGDHGPYIEFEKSDIKCKLVNRVGLEVNELLDEYTASYYIWLTPNYDPTVKMYWQIKPVTNLRNAPIREDGLPSAFNRVEGYADYKRNKYYVNPFNFDKEKVLKI